MPEVHAPPDTPLYNDILEINQLKTIADFMNVSLTDVLEMMKAEDEQTQMLFRRVATLSSIYPEVINEVAKAKRR